PPWRRPPLLRRPPAMVHNSFSILAVALCLTTFWAISSPATPEAQLTLPSPADMEKLICKATSQKQVEDKAVDEICQVITEKFPSSKFNPDCKTNVEAVWDAAVAKCPQAQLTMPSPADMEKLICEVASQKQDENKAVDEICQVIARKFPNIKFNLDCKTDVEAVWDAAVDKCPQAQLTQPSPADMEKLICEAASQKQDEDKAYDEICQVITEKFPNVKFNLDCKTDVEAVWDAAVAKCQQAEVEEAEERAAVSRGWEVEFDLLEGSFSLLLPEARSEAADLLQRLRMVVANGAVSALEVLLAESTRADGWLNAEELASGLARLEVPGASVAAAQQLIDSLHDSVAAHGQVVVVGLFIALSSELAPAARAVDGDGPEVLGARLRWACWRRGKPERDVRAKLAGVLDAPGADARLAARELCSELGLDEATAEALGESFDRLRADFCAALPPWRCLPSQDRASLLARFVEHLATYRAILVPRLCDEMTLDAFLVVASELGDAWSRTDLTQVALLAECSPGPPPGEAPIVDGLRLARAVQPGGLSSEFEMEAKAVSAQAAAACEEAAGQPSRKATPKRRAELVPVGGARLETRPQAAAAASASAPAEPPPPQPVPPATPAVVLTSQGDGPGMYRVLEKELPVNADASRTSAAVAQLAPGTVMQVVELAEQLDGGRRRARIAQPAGWVTLANETSGFRFAERFGEPPLQPAPAAASQAPAAPPAPPAATSQALAAPPATPAVVLTSQGDGPGMYRVLEKELPVNADASRTSAAVAQLAPGTVMQVVELAEQLDGGRRRARIAQPAGWVTLANETSGFRFAERFGEPPLQPAPAAASQAPAAPAGALGALAGVPGAATPPLAQAPAVLVGVWGAQAGVLGAAAPPPAQASAAPTEAPAGALAGGALGAAAPPSMAQGTVSAATSFAASPRAVSFADGAEADVLEEDKKDEEDDYSEEFDGGELSDESTSS
ncbi:unnamed protein product, partial [Prorocentrum cordatum]